jgi:hypothetical protein
VRIEAELTAGTSVALDVNTVADGVKGDQGEQGITVVLVAADWEPADGVPDGTPLGSWILVER